MSTQEIKEQVRVLRRLGRSPKEIARALGLRPAEITPLVRAVAAEDQAHTEEREVAGCWVNPGWSDGLTVGSRPDWPTADATSPGVLGLVGVLVAREAARGRVSVCGYLVDVYCLGVKDVLGPRVMDRGALVEFVRSFFHPFEAQPLAAPLELAQHIVFGAIQYARSLGFEPTSDFETVSDHLGQWAGPSAIGFGRDGKPFFAQGPRDDAARVMKTLERSVGRGNFDFLAIH